MNDWETQANLVLQDLNAAQAERRLDPAEYRRRRLQLLQSIVRCAGAPTARRRRVATPLDLPTPVVTVRRDRRPPTALQAALRSWTLRVWAAVMLLGAAWVYWHGIAAL
ncbi:MULTISPECIES: hypothetical protein [Xanthomonas]|uniref:Uncharacterized protein n=1 Tax=Xanthomonas phaseoli pv. dieffenbachiae TaxID=92828 RepID=A0A1V9GXG3_9XANT|nr:hypothetical protein [Xanthomonas phaseoli]MBO9769303.1 hypothetical protein [Xanthomonas phaseoli pv. dieffenbachiae]MBO9776530.1 hypothetical protein [Xanthomonas phaseoli pv. dieffenbachiae]MBO9782100.1 hypothetical protein [Xanthomonas phaseoli pv. dieffenbachiae]MBO9788640.1 hypothetical protein [Xanthomonas phaseoli pv. dieffenbachiae]MBO9797834.1 hypothetical protein [Xanthomonas phaseoli pv. dieffenbachiae]